MFIKDSKRFNIHATATIDGVTYHNFLDSDLRASLGITEVPEPQPPEEYLTQPEYWYRTEQDDAPYVVYTRKSDEQIATQRWEAIKQIRDDLTTNGGCLVQGKWFHSDVASKQQQMALYMLGGNLPLGIQWKTMDGSFIEMTPTLASSLFASQVAREQAIFVVAETKRSDTSNINDGWPARYTEEVVTE